MSIPAPGLWLTLRLSDVPAMLAWLTAIGFTELASYHDETGRLLHAEYLWPNGGGVMVGAQRDSPQWPQPSGAEAAYLVTDDVDESFRAALSAGGTTLSEPADEEYGGRGAAVRDPDGNLWSFGTYAPGADPDPR